MNKYVNSYLFDILSSINEIENYVSENRTYEYYCSSKMLQRSVERNLEIIGEAMNRILKVDKSVPIQNAKEIISTRNKISHGYEQVNHDVIWGIVINQLPRLKSQVEKLLSLP